eukprot:365630-Chlamydomonas_euryale.AAC.20
MRCAAVCCAIEQRHLLTRTLGCSHRRNQRVAQVASIAAQLQPRAARTAREELHLAVGALSRCLQCCGACGRGVRDVDAGHALCLLRGARSVCFFV